jgi:hypothetical protein
VLNNVDHTTVALVAWALSRVVVGAATGLRGWNVVGGCFFTGGLSKHVPVTTAQCGFTTGNSGTRAVKDLDLVGSSM